MRFCVRPLRNTAATSSRRSATLSAARSQRPEDAVAAMLAAQQALSAEDFSAIDGLRVRAAIHTGTADEREGDYFGPAVNKVARLLAIGHGGQILMTAESGSARRRRIAG